MKSDSCLSGRNFVQSLTEDFHVSIFSNDCFMNVLCKSDPINLFRNS